MPYYRERVAMRVRIAHTYRYPFCGYVMVEIPLIR